MADKFLNYTGLGYFKDKLDVEFAKSADLTELAEEVAEIIAEGGEPNVIESIKKNGTEITPDGNKAVDIPIPTATKSGTGETEKITITDGQNAYDAPTVDAMEAYVSEHGGVIQKIKSDGTAMPIDASDKSVNFTNATTSAAGLMSSTDKTKLDGVEAGAEANVQADWNQATTTADDYIKNKPTIPTDLSDLTNTGQDPYATMSDVESAQVGALKPKGSVTFANLPQLTAANLNKMYNVSDAFTTTADFVEGAGKSYPAGTEVAIINDGTEQNPVYKYSAMVGVIDMSAYWTSATGANNTLEAITTSEIDALFA